jgi:flavodoxin
MDIYYFSGTGNSLFVAKELQKRIPDAKLIPIVKHLKDSSIKAGEAVGFVFPVYFTAIPFQ